MLEAILFLAILIFGIQILLGAGKIENYYKFLVWLLFAPLIAAIAWNHLVWLWQGMPLWMRIVSLAVLPFAAAALLRMKFPRTGWLNTTLTLFFDLIVSIAAFPIRFAFRVIKLVLDRERRSARLDPYRAVVGNRPPLERPAEVKKHKSDLFDR
jgi:hypothetical protein